MKPSDEDGCHRAATKVNAVSSVMGYIAKADSFENLEGSTKSSAIASLVSLHRGRRQWNGDEWKTSEPGRALMFLQTRHFFGEVCINIPGCNGCSLARNSVKKKRTTASKTLPIRREP